VHPDCPGTIGSKKLDDEVWRFVVTICENPAIVQQAIDDKIAELEAERGDIEAEAERLQHELDNVAEERQWVITQARKGGITEEDMGMQLAALEYQALDLRKKREDKLAAIAVQQQADYLKEWADEYLSGIKRGLKILDTDVEDLNDEERDNLCTALEAGRFLDKFHGDRVAALRWAILEEKRRTVRALVSDVLVVKGKNGEKTIVPPLGFGDPA
jgi:chromosome segregation ATPase